MALQALPTSLIDTHMESTGMTLFHVAAQWGSTETMSLLLAARAQGDSDEGALPSMADGTTALHLACRYGHIGTVQLLLATHPHARIDIKDSSGRTAADVAVLWGRDGVIRLLRACALDSCSQTQKNTHKLQEITKCDQYTPFSKRQKADND